MPTKAPPFSIRVTGIKMPAFESDWSLEALHVFREIVSVCDNSFDRDGSTGHFVTIVEMNNKYIDDPAAGVSVGFVKGGNISIMIHGWGWSERHGNNDVRISKAKRWTYPLCDPESIKKAQDKLLEFLT